MFGWMAMKLKGLGNKGLEQLAHATQHQLQFWSVFCHARLPWFLNVAAWKYIAASRHLIQDSIVDLGDSGQ